MNVIPAWNNGYTGRGVVVSILDDGIEKDHPDLKRNYVSYSVTQLLFIHQYCINIFSASVDEVFLQSILEAFVVIMFLKALYITLHCECFLLL